MKDTKTFAVLATDVAVLTIDNGVLKVLLTQATSKNFKGMLTLPGGLVGHKERTEEAAIRVLKEIMIKTDYYNEQLYTFDDPGRDPEGRVVTVAYLMLVPEDEAKRVTRKDASWHAVKTLPKLAYDHNEVVKAAVKRLMGKLTYTNIVYSLMPLEFTLSDLQKTYETALELTLDKRNFIKKIKSLNLVHKTTHKVEGSAHRPATLYRFRERKYKRVDLF
ncbi:MAG: NUDIX domain-containing protein [Candidatus Woesebacteria bacterium]|nr:MAG: NUDIX domain-containing protein [Candidatus Woesebacteria bacterium]